jgi:hypothetical protein
MDVAELGYDFAPLTPQVWGESISNSPKIGGFRGLPKCINKSIQL